MKAQEGQPVPPSHAECLKEKLTHYITVSDLSRRHEDMPEASFPPSKSNTIKQTWNHFFCTFEYVSLNNCNF